MRTLGHLFLVATTTFSLVACGHAAPPGSGVPMAEAGTRFVVARPGMGLSTAKGIKFGDLGRGLTFTSQGAGRGGRMKVRFDGEVEAYGELDPTYVGLRAASNLELASKPPTFLAAGDIVQVVDADPMGKSAPTKVRLRIRASQYWDDSREVIVDSEVPAGSLTAAEVKEGSPGQPSFTDPHAEVPLLGSPAGPLILTLPDNEFGHYVHFVERKGGATRVRVGAGPYLDVWTTAHVDEKGGVGGLGMMLPDYPVTLMGKDQLYCVARGTEVTIDGEVVARANGRAWARGIALPAAPTHTSVRLAGKHTLVVQGEVPSSALTAVADAKAASCP